MEYKQQKAGGGGAGEELGVWRLQWPDCNQRRWHWCRSHRPQRTQRGSLKKGQTCEAKLRFKIPESRCWGSVAFWAQRGRPVFALAGWEEEVIYSSAEKCNKLTSTDQKFNSLLFSFFCWPACLPQMRTGVSWTFLTSFSGFTPKDGTHPSTGCECVVFFVSHTLCCFLMMIFHQLDILWIHCK